MKVEVDDDKNITMLQFKENILLTGLIVILHREREREREREKREREREIERERERAREGSFQQRF